MHKIRSNTNAKKTRSASPHMIEVKDLFKSFNEIKALNGISFQVPRGDIFAFLGPNGAGKSTALKIITTVLRPSSGSIKVNGYDTISQEHQVRESIGVVFQDHTLDKELTAFENLYYHSVLYQVPKRKRKEKIDLLLENIGLWARRHDQVKYFSGGMKRRVEIIRALLHEPEILILDEPTTGLDAQTRFFLWRHIGNINQENQITIFLTTHNLEEAEKVAKNIAIIDQGQILASGTGEDIMAQTDTHSLERAFLEITGYELRY